MTINSTEGGIQIKYEPGNITITATKVVNAMVVWDGDKFVKIHEPGTYSIFGDTIDFDCGCLFEMSIG